jgi:hypothetical protein
MKLNDQINRRIDMWLNRSTSLPNGSLDQEKFYDVVIAFSEENVSWDEDSFREIIGLKLEDKINDKSYIANFADKKTKEATIILSFLEYYKSKSNIRRLY